MDYDERASDQDTLRMVNVLRMALERREEVFGIIDRAPDESTARTHLARLLDVEESDCYPILNLQVKSWLGTWRERLDEKAESLRLILERDAPQP